MGLARQIWVGAFLLAATTSCEPERIPPPAAIASSDASGTPRRGGRIVAAHGEEIRTLDPARIIDTVSQVGGQLLFDTLLDYPKEGAPTSDRLIPSLAKSWSISEDGLTLTFEIRENARFSDGSEVLAEDFVYALDRILAPETASPVASFFSGIEGASLRLSGKEPETRGLKAPAKRTLVIRLEHVEPSFPLLLAMVQTSPQKREHVEGKGTLLSTSPLGTGPFRMRSYRPGQELVVERNPHYWDETRPHLDEVVFRLGVPRESMLLSFLQGEIDVLDGRICDDALLIAKEPAWAPYVDRSPLYVSTADLFNTTKPPFSDKRVRQAFNYAIRKEDSVRLGNQRILAANGFLPPSMLGHNPNRPVWPHDPQKARALLQEAGYPHGFVVTYTTLRDEMAQKIAISMQADLKEIGVDMNIETLTFSAYLASLSSGSLAFAFSSWAMDFPDPSDFLEIKYHSRMIAAGTNDTGYQNAEVDRLLDAGRVERDVKKRSELYQKAEDIIVEDCPNLWHYFSVALDIRQPRVRGPIRHPARNQVYRDTWIANVAP